MRAAGFPSGEVAIVGAYESPRRRAPDLHPYEIQAEVVAGALADAGLERGDVEGFCTAAGFGPEGGWQMNVIELAEYLGLNPTWFDSTDIGGAAFVTHAGHAARAIAAGVIDVAVVSYAACGRSSPLPYPDYSTNAAGPGQWEAPYGFSTVASYALAAQRHMHVYGTTREQLAAIAVQCRANAAGNEHAMYRDPITVEDVVGSPPIATPLHRLDCCVVSDSGGAFVLASRKRAEQLSRTPVWLLGFGEALGQMQMNQMADFTRTAAAESGPRALASAGLRHDEIDCAQIYDSFTITVLLTLESLGFCGPGEGGAFVADGEIAPDGRLPINTDGGGLSSNHPGRRGALAVIEAVRQLRGESPGVQLQAPKTCLVNGTGGSLSATATLVLGGLMLAPITDQRSKEWFAAAARGVLLIQRCPDCQRFQFYPRRHCVHCGSLEVAWAQAAGTGTLHTFSVVYRTPNEEFADETPYVFAIVELDEGVRMTTRIVDVPFDELRCDMPVSVVFAEGELPMFTARR